MMEKFEQKLLDEIKKLLDDIAATEEPSEAKIFEWKARAENLIVRICGEGSSYHRNLMEIEEEVMRIEKERLEVEILPVTQSTFAQHLREIRSEFLKQAIGGILRGLYKDLDSGLLIDIRTIVEAEVFSDLLEMAEHLLENGYKDPAAMLIGAVLEDGLRRIARKHHITVKDDDNISSLNQKLYQKQVFNKLTLQQVKAWNDIRDSAAHGKFDEYPIEDVRLMLEGVRILLDKYLGAPQNLGKNNSEEEQD
jgi:hypothetical protein